MRFSDTKYYIESYVKCANCGVLIYDAGRVQTLGGEEMVFCSAWCEEWKRRRLAGDGMPNLPFSYPD